MASSPTGRRGIFGLILALFAAPAAAVAAPRGHDEHRAMRHRRRRWRRRHANRRY